jgi:hypothetical protein
MREIREKEGQRRKMKLGEGFEGRRGVERRSEVGGWRLEEEEEEERIERC